MTLTTRPCPTWAALRLGRSWGRWPPRPVHRPPSRPADMAMLRPSSLAIRTHKPITPAAWETGAAGVVGVRPARHTRSTRWNRLRAQRYTDWVRSRPVDAAPSARSPEPLGGDAVGWLVGGSAATAAPRARAGAATAALVCGSSTARPRTTPPRRRGARPRRPGTGRDGTIGPQGLQARQHLPWLPEPLRPNPGR
jgi:hypothetical protein